jgi:(E)-4-hydroxy-3-methylbut-2-enyl-diphosphate synthase
VPESAIVETLIDEAMRIADSMTAAGSSSGAGGPVVTVG